MRHWRRRCSCQLYVRCNGLFCWRSKHPGTSTTLLPPWHSVMRMRSLSVNLMLQNGGTGFKSELRNYSSTKNGHSCCSHAHSNGTHAQIHPRDIKISIIRYWKLCFELGNILTTAANSSLLFSPPPPPPFPLPNSFWRTHNRNARLVAFWHPNVAAVLRQQLCTLQLHIWILILRRRI